MKYSVLFFLLLSAGVSSANSVESSCYQLSSATIDRWKQMPQEWINDIDFRAVIRDGVVSGYQVMRIKPLSPADELGLMVGDRVLAVNQVRFDQPNWLQHLDDAISSSRVVLALERAGEEQEIEVLIDSVVGC